MSSETLAEPWRSFLVDIDQQVQSALDLHCIGGFAVSVHYGLARPTGDIDVVEVKPQGAKKWLAETAGLGSALYRKHKVYLQVVTVATVPYEYEERLIEVFAGQFEHLRLFVLDPYDLALSKVTRNAGKDIEDVKHLSRSLNFNLDLLERRYREELRPYVSGSPQAHDLTIKLWIDAIAEERGRARG